MQLILLLRGYDVVYNNFTTPCWKQSIDLSVISVLNKLDQQVSEQFIYKCVKVISQKLSLWQSHFIA